MVTKHYPGRLVFLGFNLLRESRPHIRTSRFGGGVAASFYRRSQGFDAALQRGLLVVGHTWQVHLPHTVGAEHAHQRQRDAKVGMKGRHGKDGALVTQYRLGQPRGHRADPVLAGPSAFDDVDVGVADLVFDVGANLRDIVASLGEQIDHVEAANRRRRPQQHFGSAVLTHHEGLHVARPHPKSGREMNAEARLSMRVPVENTRLCPASSRVRSASGSGGSVTTINTASGACSTMAGMSWQYILALVSSRRNRPCESPRSVAPPAFSFTPAVTITSCAPAAASGEPQLTSTVGDKGAL